ncbi:TonB-dependent hemoglobin/transferrin/lactoferrin family receptor [Vibrio sp. MarTm2]|uniref:TonB-dependent hemoglobin/transferrin/lactoferrin family receptor n=1 Tax=Vibrio sp. MarTm2 TaxID=2998831 RepID=UPI0022CD3B8C|nr:TonB-dependent hemoglobin/transferrin/lactoferrin family receptor [Vibrio sp. MarTm2]MDA0128659.1 TonB-dependent hemoglobin/transferrin/lactoferrin family receptor [Vibrio sp. MarTm2]
MYKRSLLSASIIVALTASVHAEEYSVFDEVVVSATKTEQNKTDVSSSIETVSAEDINKSLSTDLKQALDKTPGITVTTEGRFGISGFTIRGMGGDRIKVVVDGVQQVTPFNPGGGATQAIYPNAIEVDTLQSIEINKGASSTLYGSNALGGVVVVNTKNPDDFLITDENESRFGIKSSYSSKDSQFKNTLTYALRKDDIEAILIGTYAQGNETQTYGDGEDIEGGMRGIANPADKDMNNVLGKVFYTINDEHKVGFVFERNEQNYHEDSKSENYTMTRNMGAGPTPIITYDNAETNDESLRTRYGVNYELTKVTPVFDSLRLDLNYQTTETINENYADVIDHMGFIGYNGGRTRVRNALDKTVQFDAQFGKILNLSSSEHELTYGMNVANTHFSLDNRDVFHGNGTSKPGTTTIPDAKMTQWGVFAQDNIFLLEDRLVANLGLRYDAYKADPSTDEGFDTEHEENSNNALTGKLGAVFHFNDKLSTFAQMSQGFKAPTVKQLYYEYSSGADFTPNSSLEAEKSTSYELGLRGQNDLAKFELVGFFNKYKDFIAHEDLPEKRPGYEHFTLTNLDKVEIKGVEFSNEILLDKMFDAPTGMYSLFNIAYAEGEDKRTGESLDSVAPLTSVVGLGYDNETYNFGGLATLKMVARKTEWSSEDNIDAPGYSVFDVTAYYSPINDLTLRAGLFNAFDIKYYEYSDLQAQKESDNIQRRSQPGRNWGISVDYQF